jgi:hypothetical protein
MLEPVHYQEQHGDYVVELPHPRGFWGVRLAGATEYISNDHNTKAAALAAVRRYQAADKRRQRSA